MGACGRASLYSQLEMEGKVEEKGEGREEEGRRTVPRSYCPLQGNISVISFHQASPLKCPTPPRSTSLGTLGSLGTLT